ncbi:GNAT family N-acetyltransferase [Jannaschia donghaensis]|uniref:Ribosomal-protein-alanine acetyltransferase n=1 Tax=Jannaschia donghaensis TaxID=420998 RepID=A0A0M6YDY4_9RHOB|nr:GNAT family N-acetyltransferase [Jannaschia donghaensis]CTQ48190.1 ribosomal-protein-alanine acetyltransferase [Jannaschia donghaensis]
MIDIHEARADDRAEILRVAQSSGLFLSAEIPVFAQSFDAWCPGDPDEATLWLIAEGGGGAAMVTPEVMSDNVWNMLFIAVARERQRQGIASALLAAVEGRVAAVGGRMILVDTADADDYVAARLFYGACGYQQVGRVPGYYGDDVARISFAKTL